MSVRSWLTLAKQKRAYWTVSSYFACLTKYRDRWTRDVTEKIYDGSDTAIRVRELVKRTNYNFIVTLAAVSIIIALDTRLLHTYYDKYIHFNSDVYTDILLSVTGLSGVFIGLYYAAVSTVGSAIYAKYPISIRSLLIEERTGVIYMRLLSWLAFASLVLVAANALFNQQSPIALAFITAYSSVAIFGFVWLGRTIFNYFDPSALSNEIYKSLVRQIRRVGHGSSTSGYVRVQLDAQYKATQSIAALTDLRVIVSEGVHLRDSYIELINNMLRLLGHYRMQKGRIPHSSRWYPQKQRHEDWYRSSDSTTSIHTMTGTSLYAKHVPDTEWFEQQIEPVVFECLSEMIKKDTPENISKVIRDCMNYVRANALVGDGSKSADLCHRILLATEQAANEDSSRMSKKDWTLVADAAACLYVETAVYLRHWHENTFNAAVEKICKLPWGNSDILRSAPAGEHFVRPITIINDQIRFEFKVEGSRLTPEWYIREHAHQVVAALAQSQVDVLENGFEQQLKVVLNLQKTQPFVAAAVASRLLEYVHKLSGFSDVLGATLEVLSAERRINGLVWSAIDLEGLSKRIKQYESRVTTLFAELAPAVSEATHDPSVPDYLGQYLAHISEALVTAALAEDGEAFIALYPKALDLALKKYMQLVPAGKVPDHLINSTYGVAFSPLIDIVEIGGLALVIADAFDHPLIRKCIVDRWAAYLQVEHAGEARQRFMLAAVATLSAPMMVQRGEVTRTGWRMKLERALDKVPVRAAPPRPGSLMWLGEDNELVDHQSPLIRVLAHDHHGMHLMGTSVFTLEILKPYADKLGIALDYQAEQLYKDVEREAGRSDDD